MIFWLYSLFCLHNPKVDSSSFLSITKFNKEFKVPFFIFAKVGGNLKSILEKFEKRDIIKKTIMEMKYETYKKYISNN